MLVALSVGDLCYPYSIQGSPKVYPVEYCTPIVKIATFVSSRLSFKICVELESAFPISNAMILHRSSVELFSITINETGSVLLDYLLCFGSFL